MRDTAERTRVRRRRQTEAAPVREVNYRDLKNPFPVMNAVSEDELEAVHIAALSVLEDLGVKVLLPEARELFASAGALVDPDTEMVRIGRDIVEGALLSAPKSFRLRAGVPERDLHMELGRLIFQPGAGCPHATDLVRGRRPGTDVDFRELVTLTQAFDALHMVPPLVEPQNVAPNVRHYFTLEAQLTLSDKLPFIFSRGKPQVAESFEMLKLYRGLSEDEFHAASHCYTIINTNSPRQIDVPMAQGLIDFARSGQVSIVTPFTLMGAMAPITVAGAMTLSHAEAMAAIVLTQAAKPGAPVCYGTFTSNVDMKSGAPAFGTPEHFRASLLSGQLARRIGLPWRCASGSAAAVSDVQAAHETQFGLWGCLLAGATVVIHSAGWLEGGLTISYEKLITDMEAVQMVADLCAPTEAGDAAIGLDALAEVQPGGHFFAAGQTMKRYQTEFYEPLNADWSNYGTWVERGRVEATERATGQWQRILTDAVPPPADPARVASLQEFIARRTEAGGAPPES
ncbi:MAG: trimethylamine methyltransferase family protein, partial [Pseudomonadota bacterium]